MPADFEPAWWCRNPHWQTILAGLRPAPRVPIARVRHEAPDGDFLDIDVLDALAGAPRLVVLHGLESSSEAPAVRELLRQARQRGWGGWAMNFRGCSGEPNRQPRSYHGGETGDLGWVLARLQQAHPESRLACVGISLGGNVLLKYLGEQGAATPKMLRAAVAISAPFDLAASVRALEQGFSRIYEQRLVATLKRKTWGKLAAHPGLVDPARLRAVRRLGEFDELVTAPVHGFASAAAYWQACSSAGFLSRIRLPTLLINAADDPFLPAAALPREAVAANPALTALFSPHGGHIGFLGRQGPGALSPWAESRAAAFLAQYIA